MKTIAKEVVLICLCGFIAAMTFLSLFSCANMPGLKYPAELQQDKVDFVISQFKAQGYDLEPLLQQYGAEVFFGTSDQIHTACQGENAYACYFPTQDFVLLTDFAAETDKTDETLQCVHTYSALAHELIHYFDYHVNNYIDYKHANTEFWMDGSFSLDDTLEGRMWERVSIMCGFAFRNDIRFKTVRFFK